MSKPSVACFFHHATSLPVQSAELAATYVLLASLKASYATGEVFTNTGGIAPV